MNEEQCERMVRYLEMQGFVVHTWRENDGQFYHNDMRRKDSCKYVGDICIWLYHENERGKCLNGVVHVSEFLTPPLDCLDKVGISFDSSKTDFKTAVRKAVEKYVEKYPDKAKAAKPFLKDGSFHKGKIPSLYPYYLRKRQRDEENRLGRKHSEQ